MFVYLSKKIAIPNNVKLRCLSWNAEQGWIACGGEGGFLKVLRLESSSTKEASKAVASGGKPAAVPPPLNQALDGHNGAVLVLAWNEVHQKLTTSDESGLIIVWMMLKGMWYEEMINNRNKSVVRDMKWTGNGEKICIVYEDGAVIVGSVDGNRMWGKELGFNLSLVEWSPDGRLILFCSAAGEVHVYDSNGNAVSKVPLYCNEGYVGPSQLVSCEWYDGILGHAEPNCPVLAICLDNGRMQLMRYESDDNAVCIDTGIKTCKAKWNCNGSILAVAGYQLGGGGPAGEAREVWMVQFYNFMGEHLRTLRVPGGGISALSWEGDGLRLALAVDSAVFFANVRPDYKWSYFCNTLVYAFTRPDRPEHCVMFWDTLNNDKYPKYVRKLVGIQAHGDFCVLATKGEAAGEYILILCNAIGSPVDSKYIEVEPKYLTMTNHHVIAASDDLVYVWQFRTSFSKILSTDVAGVKRKDVREKVFHIDNPNPSQASADKPQSTATSDTIAAMCASDSVLMIGRSSGVVHRYSLPHLTAEGQHLLRCRPYMMDLNCNCSKMSIIDINGILSFYDLTAKGHGTTQGEHLAFERKDAWDMKWASDNPELFAMMEKTKMYIFRGLDPEEPVPSSANLCNFSDLEIKGVFLDDIMQQPDQPDMELMIMYETRSLRDTRDLLKTTSMEDAFAFVDNNSHPRLWRILAEHALEQLDFNMADRAFVRCADYQGIQFVKHLSKLDDRAKQRAEIAVYFKRFDEAEQLYHKMDRPDLAIEMRSRLGDWFKVEKLIQQTGGDDTQLSNAWNKIGQYYSDRHKWLKAAQFYTQARNSDMLIHCYYALEDFKALGELMKTLPEGSPLLLAIGDKFQSVGLCSDGVAAFLKAGDTKKAVDCCILLNQWDLAVSLAQQHNFAQIEGLLAKYAQHLLEKESTFEAIELYRTANHHMEAANLLIKAAKEAAASKVNPLRVKKLYVLAALEMDAFKKQTMEASNQAATAAPGTRQQATQQATAAQTLAGLMTLEAAAMSGGGAGSVDSSWRGAEAYHFWLLAHRQLYSGAVDLAMRTALHLRDYDDFLDPVELYSFLCLAAFYNQFYGQCSKAFIKLESFPSVEAAKKLQFSDLAMSIFLKSPPVDPRALKETRDKSSFKARVGSSQAAELDALLDDLTRSRDQVCVASGRIIRDNNYLSCKTCKHPMIISECRGLQACPLCHSPMGDKLRA